MLEVDQVIKAIVDQDFGDADVDMACVRRLEGLADACGPDGERAIELLATVKSLLKI